MKYDWEILQHDICYDGFFTLSQYRIRHSLFEGGESSPIVRELIEPVRAAAVLPYDAALDSTLLLEQFRVGAMHNRQGPWLLEYIAGIVDEDETGEEVVRREAMEEAGLSLGEVHHITTYYPSPGGSSETVAVYWAEADLSTAGGIFGVAEEGENIRATVRKFDEVVALLDSGAINNSLTMLLTLWFERYRRKMQR